MILNDQDWFHVNLLQRQCSLPCPGGWIPEYLITAIRAAIIPIPGPTIPLYPGLYHHPDADDDDGSSGVDDVSNSETDADAEAHDDDGDGAMPLDASSP